MKHTSLNAILRTFHTVGPETKSELGWTKRVGTFKPDVGGKAKFPFSLSINATHDNHARLQTSLRIPIPEWNQQDPPLRFILDLRSIS